MYFSVDRTRSYIKVEEPSLISIHHSVSPVSNSYSQGHEADAFICVLLEYNYHRVYIALHDTLLKSNTIFTAEPIKSDSRKLAALAKEAELFLQKMGFEMEPVNLEFSTATREVIIKNTKVMREPSLAIQLEAAKLAVEGVIAENKELVRKAKREHKTLKSEIDELRRSMAASNNVSTTADRELQEKLNLVQQDYDLLRDKEKQLRDDLSKVQMELKQSIEESAHLKGQLAKNGQLGLAKADAWHTREEVKWKQEVEDLKGCLNTSEQELEQARVTLELARREFKEELTLIQGELKLNRLEIEKLNKQLSARQVDLDQAKDELEAVRQDVTNAQQARDELKSARKELLDRLKSAEKEADDARDELEEIRAELVHITEASEAYDHKDISLESLEAAHRAQTDQLNNEMAAELKRVTESFNNELDVLRTALGVAEEALAVERAKNESALQEMDALERNAAAELKMLKKKIDSLTADKQLLEKMAAEMKTKAHGEIERLQQLNQSQRKSAVKKVNALKEEIRQLAEARSIIESPTGTPLVQFGESARSSKNIANHSNQPVQPSTSGKRQAQAVQAVVPPPNAKPPVPDSTAKANSFPAVDPFDFSKTDQSFSSDPFGEYATEYVEFLGDKSLKGIPYTFSSDIVAIYRSFNTIHAAPTGKQAQKCDGFVVMVKEGGHEMVYAAWRMNSSGEVLVCLPETNDMSPDQLMREGIGYFERIGFIVESVLLEAEPDRRQVQLDEFGIFCRNEARCAA